MNSHDRQRDVAVLVADLSSSPFFGFRLPAFSLAALDLRQQRYVLFHADAPLLDAGAVPVFLLLLVEQLAYAQSLASDHASVALPFHPESNQNQIVGIGNCINSLVPFSVLQQSALWV